MKRTTSQHIVTLLLALMPVLPLASIQAQSTYRQLKEIPLEGKKGGDCLFLDDVARRLYVTMEDRVAVINVDQEQVIGQVTNVPGVRAFAAVSRFHRVFFYGGQGTQCSVVDVLTGKNRGKLSVGRDPGAILYEPGPETIYVFNRGNSSVSSFEADDNDALGTIPLAGAPQGGVVDPKARRLYCSIGDKNEINVIDSGMRKGVSRWPVAPGEAPSGLALDRLNHRLFVGCANQRLVVLDSTKGQVIGAVALGQGAEAVAFDPATGVVLCLGGEGTLSLIHEAGPEKFTITQTLPIPSGARAMALDAKTHRIFVSAAASTPAATASAVASAPAASRASSSLRILVFGPEPTQTH